MATLLASANGDTTLEFTLDADIPADGTLHVVYAEVTVGYSNDRDSSPSAATDTNSHVYTVLTTAAPLIGAARGSTGTTPTEDSLQVGSIARACVAGDLLAGDTVTVTFTSAAPSLFSTAGLLVHLAAPFTAVPQPGFGPGGTDAVAYGNSSDWPDFGFSDSELTWGAPPVSTFGSVAEPDANALMITAMGAYPAQAGFSPFASTIVGEIATGACSIACAVANVAAGADVDPGGTWPAAAELLAGNYQFHSVPSGAGVHARIRL